MDAIIKDHPSWSLLSQNKLIKAVRDRYDVSVATIKQWYQARELSQIHKAKPKQDEPLCITADPYSFQIDVFYLPKYKSQNDGIAHVLLLVDTISRKAFAYSIKSANMESILDGYEEFIQDFYDDDYVNSVINSMSGDNQFNNKQFLKFNEEMGIIVRTGVAKDDHLTPMGNRLAIVDSCTRTLKNLIRKYMLEHQTQKWISFLQDVLELYNDSPNTGLGGDAPNEVWSEGYEYMNNLYVKQHKSNIQTFDNIKLPIGSQVRTMLGKETFEKEKQRWSTSLYTIHAQDGYRYQLKSEAGTLVKRLYRPNELQLVENQPTSRIDETHLQNTSTRHSHGLRMRRAAINEEPPERDVRQPIVYEKRDAFTRAVTRSRSKAAR